MQSKELSFKKALFRSRKNFSGSGAIFIAVLLLLSHVSLMGKAEEGKITASVSATNITVGDQLQVTFTINGNGKNFKAPPFTEFNVLMGPSQSSNVQIVNGSFSQTLSFTYVLQAVKEGAFRIGPAEIYIGNSKIYSNAINITVAKGTANQQGGQQQGNQNGGDAQPNGGKNVFLKVRVDKSSAYRGEGIVVVYRLYTKVTLINYAIEKLPAMSGFWNQEITMPQQPNFQNENIDGALYKVADVKKLVVFPQREGNLQIDPMECEVIARIQVKRQKSNDPFDQFFSDPFFNNPFFSNNVQDIKIPLKSEAVRINVRELPPGAPAGFTGAVGSFVFEGSLDKKETKAHEPVTLKIKVSGKGNIKLIVAPTISFPPDFETYDPKETANVNATASGVSGSKTFEFLMIPRNAGEFKIPITSFCYFNLEKKKYEEIPAPEFVVRVTKGDETVSSSAITGVSKSDIQFLGKDIRFIKTNDPVFIQSNQLFLGSGIFYSALIAPFILFGGLLLVRRRQISMQSNLGLLKSQRANKVAMKRLSSAKKFLASNDKEKFLDEMFKALWGFIGDKLVIPVAELSKESAANALRMRQVPEELITLFSETIDTCEFARFAGSAGESNESIYSKGIDLIARLEDNIRS